MAAKSTMCEERSSSFAHILGSKSLYRDNRTKKGRSLFFDSFLLRSRIFCSFVTAWVACLKKTAADKPQLLTQRFNYGMNVMGPIIVTAQAANLRAMTRLC